MAAWYESVKEESQGKWPFKPRQSVHSDGRSSIGELLTYFCYIFIIISVVTLIIYFSLQEKYKEEVVKNTARASTMRRSSLTAGLSDSGGGKAHGRWDQYIVLFNIVNARYNTSYYCWLLFLKVCPVRWGAGLQGGNATEVKFIVHVLWSYALCILDTLKLWVHGKSA
jgi:Ca2+/H+ antiporter